jgi:uncharacterized phage infection (PIP) family protein YhgE
MKSLQDKNREILQRVDNLNSELSKLRTRMQDNERFLFGEINDYKIKANEMLGRIAQLTKANAELVEKYNAEIEGYKLQAFQNDSIIQSLNDAIMELNEELKIAQSKISEDTKKPSQPAAKDGEPKDYIRVIANPTGALVYANSKYIGKSPYSYINPPRGKILIEVKFKEHETHGWNINYTGGAHVLKTNLKKLP